MQYSNLVGMTLNEAINESDSFVLECRFIETKSQVNDYPNKRIIRQKLIEANGIMHIELLYTGFPKLDY